MQIQKSLYENIQLQYDPTLIGQINRDQHSADGGFVLYCRNRRIDNPVAYLNFILDIIMDVGKSLSKKEQDKDELRNVLKILIPYIDTKEFISYLLIRYHTSNRAFIIRTPHNQPLPYDRMHFTPWMTRISNNSKTVLKVYLESDRPIVTEQFISKCALEALTNIIDMCKHMPSEEKKLFIDNPNKLKPLCITGKHRLPFMAGNPSLANAWKQDYPTSEWIEQHVLIPGREISNTFIDKNTHKALIKILTDKFFPQFFSAEEIKKLSPTLKQFPNSISIKDYRQLILKICKKVKSNAGIDFAKLTRQVDTAICEALNPMLKNLLENSAVHFADTNWGQEGHDIHFCFAVNPGTGELELWEAYSDGSHLSALDQTYWLFNQKWEFFTLPEELIPDDATILYDEEGSK